MTATRPAGLPWLRLDGAGRFAGGRTPATSSGVVIDTDIALGVAGVPAIADTEPMGSFGGRRLARGIAVAPDGRVFLADPAGRRVLWYRPGGGADKPAGADDFWPFTPLWPAAVATDAAPCAIGAAPDDPYALVRPLDVAVSPCGDLVIADTGRVLVLAWPSLQLRHVVAVPDPVALGFDARGRGYVLDAASRRVLRFTADWRRDADYRADELAAPTALAVAGGWTCGCAGACGCAPRAGEDGAAFVLDGRTVVALDPRGRVIDAPLPATLAPLPFAVDAAGGLTHDDGVREPLRLPGIAVDRRGFLAGTALPLLARARRTALPRSGTFVSGALEGDREGFAWHRVTLDAEIPARARLVVETLTSDALLEPARVATMPADAWSVALALTADDAPEVLVQSPPGRYLWLRLSLYGDGTATPRITAIEVHAPRASSFKLLPAPFHQEPESASFVDRLLGYFDTVRDELLATNRDFAAQLTPAAASGAYLDWLGSWFDWRFLREWPEATRREMVARSVEYFRMRGTVAGLQLMLRWHTGLPAPHPTIVEHFRLRGRREPLQLAGAPLAPARRAHGFTILLPRSAAPTPQALATIHALIEVQKPAHTHATLRLFEPGIRIGLQATIGVDMLLGGGAEPLGRGRLGATLTTARKPPAIGEVHLTRGGSRHG